MPRARGVVVGIEELERKLKSLEKLPESPQLELIFVHAARIAEAAVWSRSPVGRTGNLRKGIISGPLPGSEIGAFVGAKAPHSHLLEFGTKERKQKSGRGTGKGPPTQFFSRGINTGKRRFRPYVVDEIRKLVIAEAK